MDKRQIIGLVLIFALFFLWSINNGKARQAALTEQKFQDSIELVKRNKFVADSLAKAPTTVETVVAGAEGLSTVVAQKTDSLQDLRLQVQYGAFGANAIGSAQEYVLENNKLKITLNSKGGKISEVLVKEHKKIIENEEGEKIETELKLLEDAKNRFSYILPVKGVAGNIVDSEDLYFTASQSGNTITFTAGANNEFKQTYSLNEGYDLNYDINFSNQSGTYVSDKDVKLKWDNYLDKIELNDYFERFYSSVYFKETGESSDYCNCRKSDTEEVEEGTIDWVSHVNQFFSTSLIAKGSKFGLGKFETKVLEDEDVNLKLVQTEINIPSSAVASGSFPMTLYAGPNEFKTLKAYDAGLEEIIPFGRSIFGTINRWVIRPLFNFFDNIVHNKGIAIILMILLIKVCLYPLTYKMLHSQAKMGALKPELKGLKEKYKDDAQTQQVETMKIYREYGVSPLGGCMPMLIQMPIWYALFRFFPASIGFRQESFLWATDLSSFDDLIKLGFELPLGMGSHLSLFTILWVITQLIYTYYNTKHMDMSANPAMKYVQYLMPVMFLAFFNQYASGLTVYMFFSNLFNIAQTIGTKKLVFNEDKLRQQLMANKLKPKKRSKFMQNIDNAVKQQQAAQKDGKKKK